MRLDIDLRRTLGAVRLVCAAAVLALAVLSPGTAAADSWLPPRPTTYVSSDRNFRLLVTPRALENGLSYFEDLVDERPNPGQRPGGTPAARGKLERRVAGGRWTTVWDAALVNDVAPVRALVSDDGAYVVTFDNWHQVGIGEHVVVIYDGSGTLVRSLMLTDIVPETYAKALPRSVSSLHWGGEHRLSGDELILRVVVPGEPQAAFENPDFVEVAIDLSSGVVRTPDGPAWRAALAAGERRGAEIDAEVAAWRAEMAAPLLGPDSGAEVEWHGYLREAFYRLWPDWEESYPNTKVLRRPEADNYAPSLGWLRAALTEPLGGVLMFGSPSQQNLAAVLASEARKLDAGSLSGVTVYVAVDDTHWSGLNEAFAGSGARLVQLDPGVPIPQRSERMPE